MIGIITCSGSAISPEEAKQKGIYMLPLQITFANKNYREFKEITTEEIYKRISNKELVKTATPLMEDARNAVKEMQKNGITEAIILTIGTSLSGTANLVKVACEEFSLTYYIIDCYTSLYVEKYYVLKAKEMIDLGYKAKDIVEKINEALNYCNTIMLPDSLDYFILGGRISKIKGKLGNALGIKPVLVINKQTSGHIDSAKKFRTRKKAYAEMVNIALSKLDPKDSICYVSDVLNPLEKENFCQLIKAKYNSLEVVPNIVTGVFACHTGIKVLCVQIVKKIVLDSDEINK